MDAGELLEWRLLETIDPWGQVREDYRAALTAFSAATAFGGSKGLKLESFLLKFVPEEVADQTPDQIASIFKTIVAANNKYWEKKEAEKAAAKTRLNPARKTRTPTT